MSIDTYKLTSTEEPTDEVLSQLMREADVVCTRATAKEQALAKVDHALGQLRQMKDGQLQGINAEELLNEL